MTRLRPLLPTVVLALCASALAVRTENFRQQTAEEFREGTAKNVVITDRGEVRLSRKVTSLLPASTTVGAITAMAVAPDGGVTIATFPQATILKLKDGRVETLATMRNRTITALAYDAAGQLLIGTAGERGEVARLDKQGDEPTIMFRQEGVDYVWAILPQADGELLLATGPHGAVYGVTAGAEPRVIATLDGSNVTALLAHENTLYAGTDREGLVYAIDRKSGDKRLLFDAAESEIIALAIGPAGDLLAAASDARPTPPTAPAIDIGGPEGTASDAPRLPGDKPDLPAPAGREHANVPTPPDHAGIEEDATPENEPATRPAVHPAGPIQPGAGPGEVAAGGNTVYKIGKDGFVSTLYRAPAVLFSMAVMKDRVLLGTGDHGDVYELIPGAEEAVVAAHLDGAQVNAITVAPDGRVLLGSSNAGGVYELSASLAGHGTYESAPLDTGTISAFGTLRIEGIIPEGSGLTISARTGNASDPESNDWEPWTDPHPAREFNPLALRPGRFVQYRLGFTASAGDGSAAVQSVSLAYQKPNAAPRVSSVVVTPVAEPPGTGSLAISWTAEDANGDTLRYDLFYRIAGRGDWVELARDLETNSHTWPGKQAADGRYEFKVVASDAGDNRPGTGQTASRVSSPVTIDNAPPMIGDVEIAVGGEKPAVRLRVVDRGGVVSQLNYSINRADHWQLCLPDDTIADSPEERYTIPLDGLAKGRHTLTVRATDENGNAAFEVVRVTVP